MGIDQSGAAKVRLSGLESFSEQVFTFFQNAIDQQVGTMICLVRISQ